MKRTTENVLSVIGILLYGLTAGLGGIVLLLRNNEELLQEIMELEQESQTGMNNMDTLIEGLSVGGWLLIIVSIIAILLGIVAKRLMKENKQPKRAGTLFIVVSILGSIFTLGFGIIPGVFYLIAGIMCLVRKPTVQY